MESYIQGSFSRRLMLISLVLFTCLTTTAVKADPLQQLQDISEYATKKRFADQLLGSSTLNPQQTIAIHQHIADTALNNSHFDDALSHYQHIEQLVDATKNKEQYFKAIKMQGVVYYYLGKFSLAINEYNRALAEVDNLKEPVQKANLLSNIGLAFFNMHDLESALDYYQQAKVIYQQYGSAQDRVDILHNIAGLHVRLSSFETALTMYRSVLDEFIKLDDKDGMAQVYANMGVVYNDSGQPQLALEYYLRALHLNQQENNTYLVVNNHVNVSNVYLRLERVESAVSHAKDALLLAKQLDNQALEMAALFSLSRAKLAQGSVEEAEQAITQSMLLAAQVNDQMRLHSGLAVQALVAASAGKYMAALQFHEKYIAEQNVLANEELIKSLGVLQNQIQESQLSQELNDLKQRNNLQQLEMSQQRQMMIMTLVILLLLLITGITVYRRNSEKRAKALLEEQVTKRTEELQDAAEQLRQANEVKSQFLANISHEIRTPLTAILGQTEDLINGAFNPTELKSELLVVKRHSDHLKDLINDVLDLSKIEANKLELSLTHFDLVTLTKDVHAMFKAQAMAKQLHFQLSNELDEHFWVELDYTRVKQVLINLCSNAIKFTQQGQIKLKLVSAAHGVKFIVSDSGIGMTTEQVEMIFDCFRQGDNSISRRFGGTGLGLSLSQQLAIMMGGYISVKSEVDKGSEFAFFLPCKQLQVQQNESKVVETAKVVQLQGKVVLAEDHEDNRRLITRYLKSLGLTVFTAENGKQAVELCLLEFPDIALVDIQMPEMDGLAALTLLRESGFTQPVYALTANAMSHEVESYLQAGFTGYLSKPLDKAIFYQEISQYCQPNENETFNSVFELDDLLISFKHSLHDEKRQVQQHLQQQDYASLLQDAHRIAGAAKVFAFDDLAQAGIKLERALKQQQLVQVDELVKHVIQQLEASK